MKTKEIQFKLLLTLLAFSSLFVSFAEAQITVSGSTGANGTYTSLTNASGAFQAINSTAQTGNNIVITITASSTSEAGTYALNAGTWTTLTMYPTSSGLSISGNVAAPLLDLNGADNVTIDGRVNATGTTKDLTISNTSNSSTAGTCTMRFINDATSNTVKYCSIKGSSLDPTGGILNFSTTTGTTGNDGNTIDNNNITNAADTDRPLNVIFSLGSSGTGLENSGNTISNNNIFDFMIWRNSSNAINLSSYTTAWTISGNSFYESTAPYPGNSWTYYIIKIDNPSGTNFSVNGNYIGGSSALCAGMWTKHCCSVGYFTAIYLNVGTGIVSNIQNNTIKNFFWANGYYAIWSGIQVAAGDVNIGTITGNTIGAATGTGSITVTFSASAGSNYVYPIYLSSSGTVACCNNTIGSITTGTDTYTANPATFIGIYRTGGGNTMISNNLIGSTDAGTTSSINATSSSTGYAQYVYGICNVGAGTLLINNNTISKLTNSSSSTGTGINSFVNGITSTAGTNTIYNNTIRDLTIADANTDATQNASASGIVLSCITALTQTITGNNIFNLSNSYSSFAGSVIGIYYRGSTTASNVTSNFIRNLSVDAASTAASIYGIKIAAGATTYANNLISLGENTTSLLYGIYETGVANNNNSLYFNTVYLAGSPTSGALNSYALYSAVTTNVRNFRNNIFVNARSNSGATGKHYAAYFSYAVNTNLILDYNDYYAPGTGGFLGYYNSLDLNSLPLISTKDASSKMISPSFSAPGGTLAVNYYPSAALPGVAGTGIAIDLNENSRAATPKMGALEASTAPSNAVDVYIGASLQASYTNIRNAFDKINDGTHTGNLILKITGNQSLSTSATLNASGLGGANYSAVQIYPTTTGLTINGSLASPLIDLNGADNVTIDGRVNATGSTKDLTISNESTSAVSGTSTIRFINDATANLVKYCTIKGSSTNTTGGVVHFSTTTGSTGNDGNTINNNNITNAADVNRPINAIFSLGTSGKENSGNTISNNYIYDFLNRGGASNGISLSSNTTAWTISGNSFYETATFSPPNGTSCVYNAISIDNTSGTNFSITGNMIGGNSASGAGTWTKTCCSSTDFNAIYLNVGTGAATSVQNNTITNISWNNWAWGVWSAIQIAAGDVNIGTVTGNTIGATTGNGSISVIYQGATGSNYLYPIYITGSGMIDCQNNTIGSINVGTGASTSNPASFVGIYRISSAGSMTIANNLIGSTDAGTTNSINATSISVGTGGGYSQSQYVYGICNTGGGTIIINNNTISKLNNSSTNSVLGAQTNGITSVAGTNTITNNTVRDLTSPSPNTNATYLASVCGIALSYTTAAAQTITGNTIYNLSNSCASYAGSIIGLYYFGSGTSGMVGNNFIYGLSVTGTPSTTASLYGIKIDGGAATYANNIISLGGNTTSTLYGIYETGASGTANNLYFNTVYLAGSPTSGALNSYALYSASSGNTRNFRNNIFSNARSNSGATGQHYAAYFNYTVSTNLTLDYNDYYAPNTGGVLGYYNSQNVLTRPLITTMDFSSKSINPLFASAGGTTPINYLPSAPSLVAAAGTGITTDYAGTVRRLNAPSMGAYEYAVGNVYVTATAGTGSGIYASIKDAFDKINDGTHQGVITTILNGSTTEIASAVLNASGSGSASYSSLNLYPSSTGFSVSGTLATPLIDLNGAKNVTIDGRVNATGSTKDLVISNTSTASTSGTSTIRFINDATTNTVKYCKIKGSTTDPTGGILNFGTTTGTTGNDGNTIDSNNITNSADANRPLNAIYSQGTSGKDNSGNTLSNNNIYDFLNKGVNSNGVNLSSNTTSWSISGNSFYETTSFVITAVYNYAILKIDNPSGTNFTISGNFIGGSSASCGGTAWTTGSSSGLNSDVFNAIYLNIGTGTASNIQNNTIKNINWNLNSCYYPSWTSINVSAGDVNIGTTVGNTIGATTGTGSISIQSDDANTFGIYIASTGIVDCRNNSIGSVTTSATSYYNNIFCIYKTATAGNTTISNNFIGSTATTNSIYASSTCTSNGGSPQQVSGIYNSGSGTITINGNTISKLTNGSTNATGQPGYIWGIASFDGTNTISNNTVYDLTISNIGPGTGLLGYDKASVIGIGIGYNLAGKSQAITGNTIYNLSNANSSFTGTVIGLDYEGSTTAAAVSSNLIYNLTVNSSSSAASIYGIKMASGATTYSNNIIHLGGNTTATLYGIYETGAASNNNNLYFNTVYLDGAPTAGSLNSYALYSASASNTRDFRNNIFDNARSNSGATGKHYATFFNYASSSSLTLDFNDYFAPGTGGVLGYYNSADITSIPLIAGLDGTSQTINPSFASAGGNLPANYTPSVTTFAGITGTGITTDYFGLVTRGTPPAIGAIEFSVTNPVHVAATAGTTSGLYNTLKAAFDKVNDGTHRGVITITLYGSTSEAVSAVLNASGTGSSSYTAASMYPVSTGLIISGNMATPLIDLNGADNVTIDGRVNATGSTKSLAIINPSTASTTGTSTIRFINDATTNTVKYCTIKGSTMDPTGGIVNFSTTTGTTGNDGNTIDNNNITNAADANRPLNAINSLGSSGAGLENSGNTISNNNIYDFINTSAAACGINLSSFNTAWTISGNSLYETTTFYAGTTCTYNLININNAGAGYLVTGNYIGGSSASCGGSAWSVTSGAITHVVNAIYLSVGTTPASSVQNNTIKNISWKNYMGNQNYLTWTGIGIATGNVDVGTLTGNNIGSTTGTGSLDFGAPNYTRVNLIYAINNLSTGTVNIQNNNIGSISLVQPNFGTGNFYGIVNSAAGGTITINNNILGSTSTANSINALAPSLFYSQPVYGIYNTGTGTVTINGNTIANLTNGTTQGNPSTYGLICGIFTSAGTNTITNNLIHDLTIANANADASYQASVSGITLNNSSALAQTINGNTIYNLSNSSSTFTGSVIGLYYSASTTASTVKNNFIQGLSVNSSTTTTSIFGIKIASGATTYANNIVYLGGNTTAMLYGIYESGAASNNNNLYFNTVYISGSPTSGALNSYALYSASASNTRNFRNNIFDNARSNSGATGKHYAVFFNYASSSNLTLDFNDYYAPGTGGFLGYYNSADVTSLPLVTGIDASSQPFNPLFVSAGGTNSTDYVPLNGTLAGISGTGITTDYLGIGSRGAPPTVGAFEHTTTNPVHVAATSGTTSGLYNSLKLAFDKINDGTHKGVLTLTLHGNTYEALSAVLNASGSGSASYTSANLYPTLTGISVTGTKAIPLIDLNGADNVTIDGRVNASGSSKDLVITNTSTASTAGTSTIRFINDATSNTVKYCTIKGSTTDPAGGILNFSTASTGTGNDGNLIDNNNITNASDANRPLNAIYSLGTAARENSGNTISNNYIFDFLNRGIASTGITLSSNTTTWTISGNSFYETANFVATASFNMTYIIQINNPSGTGFILTGNYIGGRSASCGGSAWFRDPSGNGYWNSFCAIYLNVGSGTASSVQSNTIKNISWTTSNNGGLSWTGININAGTVNVGNTSGNTIGATTGTGSIYCSNGTVVGSNAYGIYIGSATVDCENNNIGSFTTGNFSSYTSFFGIFSSGTATISNNLIGSTDAGTSNSINATATGNSQTVTGIYNSGTAIITGNTISKLTNASTGTAGGTYGIGSLSGANTISNNLIHDLTVANTNTDATYLASVCGIVLNYTTAASQTITGNTIYNLSNSNSSFAGNIIGLYYNGSTTSGTISSNFIYNLSVTGASSTSASLYGLKIDGGSSTSFNNIISLGGNKTTTLYGIYETGISGTTCNSYFNTVYLSGTPTSGALNSYALYSAATTNTCNFRNNILVNARTNSGASGTHYAAYVVTSVGSITCDYNDYYAPGTGGTLGYYGGAKTALPIVTGQDAHSYAINPVFTNAGSTLASDYKIGSDLAGVTVTGITVDYGSITRSTTLPILGAWERILNKWKGTTSNNWNTATNWTGNTVPGTDANIFFDDAPVNHCQMDQNRSITHLYNGQATYRLVTNGQKLTVKGNLNLSGGAQLDASSAGSTLEFAGTSTQSIPSGAFYNNEIFNLTVNNAANLTFNGTLRLLATLTATSGMLDAATNSPTLVYVGSTAQTINSSQLLNNQAYNLTSDNAAGVTLNTNFTVTNVLTINSGKLFTLAAAKALTATGTITNNAGNGGFVLNSDATGTASLLHNSNSVPATVNRYLSGSAEDWHFLSTPVTAQGIAGTWLPSGTYGNGTGYDLYVWTEPTSCWIYKLNTTSTINWNTVHPGTDFVPGRGYLYSVQATNPTKTFAGNLNNGSVNFAVTAVGTDATVIGFNLAGNPYPSSVDWKAASGWTRTPLTSSGGGYNVWIWNPAANNYGVYNSANAGDNGTNSVSRYIAPMQGYFVQAAGAGTIAMNNSVRVHNGANEWKSAEINPDKFSLVVHSQTDNSFDEVLLMFGYPTNQNVAKKLFSHVVTAPSLYTPSGDQYYSVKYLTDNIDNPTVPVMFKPGRDGKYSLQASFDASQFEFVFLEDRQTNSFQNLKNNPVYSFSALKTDDANRFILHFTPIKMTADATLPANIFANANGLNIDLTSIPDETDLFVYDVLGRVLRQQKLQGNTSTLLEFGNIRQLVVVSLKNQHGSLNRKIVIGR